MLTELKDAHRAVGVKQSRKALKDGLVKTAFIAGDADENVSAPMIGLCRDLDVPIVMIETMDELGSACGINVGAAIAVLFKD